MGRKVTPLETSIVDIRTYLDLIFQDPKTLARDRLAALADSEIQTERVALRSTIELITQAIDSAFGESYAIKNPALIAQLIPLVKPSVDSAISQYRASTSNGK